MCIVCRLVTEFAYETPSLAPCINISPQVKTRRCIGDAVILGEQ